MNNQHNLTQITFHYANGQSESFNLLQSGDNSLDLQALQQEITQLLNQPWCVLHLPEQTICVNTANVLKVEMKPPLWEMQGAGVFNDVRRVTALSRSTQR